MRLIPYTNKNLYIRHSLLRLARDSTIDIKRLDDYLRGVTTESIQDAKNIIQVDRCISFIEGFYKRRMKIYNDDLIIALITLYPHDMMEESVLKSEFPKEMIKLNTILKENIEKDEKIFTAASKVIEWIMYSRLVITNTLTVVFLIANLLICQSGYIMIMEDTDTVSPDILMEIVMVINDNV